MNPELLTRAVSNIYPNTESFKKALESGKKLKIYFGIDPTGPDLHLGHAVPMMKLRELQDLDHEVILLIGDFTAMIGDPTDKTATRVKLSAEQVRENCRNYLGQAWKILDEKKTEVKYNSEWLSKLNFAEVLELASNLTVPQLLKREMFQKRLDEGKELFLHELLYPVMQGYDSVALDVDAEIGGNDQTFNMLVGRDLMKSVRSKEKFVLATKLLAAPGEAKMSKTEGNMITLADNPSEMYGKVMSWSDALLPLGFELCTRVASGEIEEILAGHPRDAKMRLAREIVSLYHGTSAAEQAEQGFIKTFQKGEEPEQWENITGKKGEKLAEVLLRASAVESKSAWRRLVDEKAVHLWPEGELSDPDATLEQELKLKIGKKRFIQIKIQN